MRTNKSEDKTLDNQLLSLMTHVQAFLKGRLTLGELGEAEERAEIFRTSHVTNYDKAAERVNSAQLERENAELLKDKARLDWLLDEDSGVNIEWIYRKDGKPCIQWFDERSDIDKAIQSKLTL
jgi:hypothetical protein